MLSGASETVHFSTHFDTETVHFSTHSDTETVHSSTHSDTETVHSSTHSDSGGAAVHFPHAGGPRGHAMVGGPCGTSQTASAGGARGAAVSGYVTEVRRVVVRCAAVRCVVVYYVAVLRMGSGGNFAFGGGGGGPGEGSEVRGWNWVAWRHGMSCGGNASQNIQTRDCLRDTRPTPTPGTWTTHTTAQQSIEATIHKEGSRHDEKWHNNRK